MHSTGQIRDYQGHQIRTMTTKQIGASMRKARGQRSIREVASAAHLSRHQVTSIEQATTNYTIQSLLALAKVVEVTIQTNR